MHTKTLGLFEAIGIEIEYMIVNQKTLAICPFSDRILQYLGGEDQPLENEINVGPIAVSNELVMHVLELKTNGPVKTISDLADQFYKKITEINQYLKTMDCQLLPTGAHPFLLADSDRIQLWPHGDKTIYETFNSIFNCKGHGWVNLQSVHINLPFATDEEFSKLHSAIRLILPMIPALAASTPILENKIQENLDTRLLFYGQNQALIPAISGFVIPELVHSQAAYVDTILNPMYDAIAPHDPAGILQYEWLNSRGAIARFDRNAIEIRVMDAQECANADLACIAAVVGVLKYLILETTRYRDVPMETSVLKSIYDRAIKDGLQAQIESPEYWESFGFEAGGNARHFWKQAIAKAKQYIDDAHYKTLEIMIEKGSLAERIVSAMQKNESVSDIYHRLLRCLADNKLFL